MNFATDEQRFNELSEDDKKLLRKLWVIKGSTLAELRMFYPYEEIKNLLVRLPIDKGIFPYFLSHRWESIHTPDPENFKYSILHSHINMHKSRGESYYWYDYSCAPQTHSNENDNEYFQFVIDNLNLIVQNSKILIIRRLNDDYFQRGWCFHEWFNAQFLGKFDRSFLEIEGLNSSSIFSKEIVQAKRFADRLLCGELSMLNYLNFTKERDRNIVEKLTKDAIEKCQMKISETCIDFILEVIKGKEYAFPNGINLTPKDIYERFNRLVKFIKIWTLVLQQVHPVTDRIAMFFHKNHWEALLRNSQPIAVQLLSLEYAVELNEKENLPIDKELRDIYELCQRNMPEARFAVTAFLCFNLMGYEIN